MKYPPFKIAHGCLLLVVLALVTCATDEKEWEAACKVNTRDSYQAFLQKHPSGKYSAEGLRRVEEFDWNAAQKTDDAPGYETYMRQYPKGAHLAQAEARLDVVRPIQGVFGVALPQVGGLGPGGEIQFGHAILTLGTSGETLVLRRTPDTAYLGIAEERGGVHKWFPGGKYEVIGQKTQPHETGSECGPNGVCMLFGTKNGWETGSWHAWGTMGRVTILGMTTGPARSGPNVIQRDLVLKSIRYLEGGQGPMSLPD